MIYPCILELTSHQIENLLTANLLDGGKMSIKVSQSQNEIVS